MKLNYHIENLDLKTKSGSTLSFQDCTVQGELSFSTSDGPFGIKEYEQSSYLEVRFDFEHEESKYRYEALITQFDLAPTRFVQTEILPSMADVLSDEIQDLVDTRDDLQIIREERTEKLRLKYSDSKFQLFSSDGDVFVKWNLYNQNISDYETIYYLIQLDRLLFLNATKLYLDDSGGVEDFDPHGEDFCNIKKLEPIDADNPDNPPENPEKQLDD